MSSEQTFAHGPEGGAENGWNIKSVSPRTRSDTLHWTIEIIYHKTAEYTTRQRYIKSRKSLEI